MVEGPGCKVKGEVMRKRIVGKTVVSAFLRERKDKLLQGKDTLSDPFQKLCGLEVCEVRTLGKELFILFSSSTVCIRIHFMMDGSVRYRDSDKKAQVSDLSLTITFVDEKLLVFKSAINLRSTEESIKHCDSLADLDICSSQFSFKRARQLVEENPNDLICDVIMDQAILPGVGNIIKNEGLFKSGINPNTQVKDLSADLITCLLHRLRDFSAVFYMCRKNNKPLKNHMSIYEKSKCHQCGTKITVCKPGNLSRLTFFCCVCQVNSIKSSIISLPKKNSILGFLQYNDKPNLDESAWQCSQCTYNNNALLLSCEMCSAQKVGIRKRQLPDDNCVSTTPAKRTKIDEGRNFLSSGGGNDLAMSSFVGLKLNAQQSDILPVTLCSGHKKECVRRKVTHSTENKGRFFYCCRMSTAKQCKFFQWADLHHPMCKHGKRTILRRVLKQNDNNGKEFYSCPLPKSSQCDFFQWAKTVEEEQIGV